MFLFFNFSICFISIIKKYKELTSTTYTKSINFREKKAKMVYIQQLQQITVICDTTKYSSLPYFKVLYIHLLYVHFEFL